MYETVLVVDRGFLAARVVRSCQRLGVKAVALVRPGDEASPHAQVADETVPFAPVDSAELAAALVEAAQVSGAQAVHPGGGLPVDSAAVEQALRAAGVDWLGPSVAPDTGRLSEGEHGVTLVAGQVADGWRWLGRSDGRPVLAVAEAPSAALVERAVAAVQPRWPVVSVADGGGLGGRLAVRPALSGVDRLVEARTGVDLVARQLGAERGEPVGEPRGYAVALALFAAPDTPPGEVHGWQVGDVEGVVIDTMLADGREVTTWPRDPLATLTAGGESRALALDRLRAALEGVRVDTPELDLAAVRALLRDLAVVG